MTIAFRILASTLGTLGTFAFCQPAQGSDFSRATAEGFRLTALDRYVAQPDPAYEWKLVRSVNTNGVTVSVLDVTSQRWLTEAEVNRPLWRHWLVVVRPEQVRHSTGLLYIGGGSNKDASPPSPGRELVAMAQATGSVVAELRMVPNQPLVFHGDGKERYEDDLIAYSWDQYLRTGDERWPTRLPMTKAAMRAMDTITDFAASEAGGQVQVDRFVVTGGSKRGWTTWASAIVDQRVVSIVPAVIDLLNVETSFVHHWRAYGFWAPAVGDYVHHQVMNWMGSREFARLMEIEDPFEYRERLTMPKLLLNATGDQFFLPDSSQFYFDRLPGPKYLRYVPNTDHSLRNSDAYETLLAWHSMIARGVSLPRFQWTHRENGTLRVQAADRPREAKLWRATNPSARDFRLETIGPVWESQPLTANDQGDFTVTVQAPEKGWTAYLVELTYDVGAARPLKLTTDVRVTPETLPFPAPKPATALGTAR